MSHYEVDARRLLCPMPVIKMQNLTKNLLHGDTVTLIATDPGARYDLPSWCRINGHQLVESKEIDGEIHLTVKLVKDSE
jgi:tRNA 2-thiouridine synthesizing protein A